MIAALAFCANISARRWNDSRRRRSPSTAPITTAMTIIATIIRRTVNRTRGNRMVGPRRYTGYLSDGDSRSAS
jgi:hypothetical protein